MSELRSVGEILIDPYNITLYYNNSMEQERILKALREVFASGVALYKPPADINPLSSEIYN